MMNRFGNWHFSYQFTLDENSNSWTQRKALEAIAAKVLVSGRLEENRNSLRPITRKIEGKDHADRPWPDTSTVPRSSG